MALTAVVLAAGQGTRMRSKTPKVLHDLCGWPLVRWPVEAARAAGADLVFLTADEREPAKEIYGRLGFEQVGVTVEALRSVAAP